MKEILDQLAKETAGPYSLIGQPIYAEIAKKLEDLKSTISFVK
jgi:hypothetical protein